MDRSRRELAFTHRRGPIEGNPNWECLASGMGNRRCGGQFHPPSLDQAALRLLPEAAAVPVHIEAYVRKHRIEMPSTFEARLSPVALAVFVT
jgi:hypothetical protein